MKKNPETSIEHGLISKEVALVNPLPPNRYHCLRVDWIIKAIGKNGIFQEYFIKGRGEGHLFPNEIADFGGPKNDIFIPKYTEGGVGGGPLV